MSLQIGFFTGTALDFQKGGLAYTIPRNKRCDSEDRKFVKNTYPIRYFLQGTLTTNSNPSMCKS